MQLRAIIVLSDHSQMALAQRTVRSSRNWIRSAACSLEIEFVGSSVDSLQHLLMETCSESGCLFLRAGVWFVNESLDIGLERMAASPTPSIAFGVHKQNIASSVPDLAVIPWREFLHLYNPGSDECSYATLREECLSSVWLSASTVASLRSLIEAGQVDVWSCMRQLMERHAELEISVRRINSLDVQYDPRLRVAQIITSLQRGGAERIAIDLHDQWLERGIDAKLVVIDRPSRGAFEFPAGVIDCSVFPRRDDRVQSALNFLSRFAPDVVHSHLLSAAEQSAVGSLGFPTIATLHNSKPGWPDAIEQLESSDINLWVGCCNAVSNEAEKLLKSPVRTVWNGIDGDRLRRNVVQLSKSPSLRAKLGIDPDAFVIVSLANPRPQKRLERIPVILRLAIEMLRAHGLDEIIHVVFAGEASANNPAAQHSYSKLMSAIEDEGVRDRCHHVGPIEDVAWLLDSCNLLLSTSQHEGLSLAQLESLALGKSVISTRVGGASEVESFQSGLRTLETDASDDQFAEQIVALMLRETRVPVLPKDFELSRMADGYLRQYRSVIHYVHVTNAQAAWIVTNNLSIGGAQSSARRLAQGLSQRGIDVHFVVLQEERHHPTPGTQAMRAANIPVHVAPKSGSVDADESIGWIIDEMACSPPRSVLFWNVMPEFKMLLASVLWRSQLIDVSPGEMNFDSLERYFGRPRTGLPIRTSLDYGRYLESAVIKYELERSRAEAFLGVPVHVIANGVEVQDRPRDRSSATEFRFGTSARLHPQKRIEDLIEAFRRVQEGSNFKTELLIAGGEDGDQIDYVQHLHQLSSGLPIRWLGHVEDVRSFLNSLDCFVMISEPAGCPNAMLEAMAVGLPIIATDVGGASEQVTSNENGLLVPPRDAVALSNAMMRLQQDRLLCQRLGAASLHRARDRFHVDRMVVDYLRVLGF